MGRCHCQTVLGRVRPEFTFDQALTHKVLRAFRLASCRKRPQFTFNNKVPFRTKCSAFVWSAKQSARPKQSARDERSPPWRSRGTVLALGLAPRAPACLVGFRRTPQARGRSGVHTGTALEILVGRTTTRYPNRPMQPSGCFPAPPLCASV